MENQQRSRLFLFNGLCIDRSENEENLDEVLIRETTSDVGRDNGFGIGLVLSRSQTQDFTGDCVYGLRHVSVASTYMPRRACSRRQYQAQLQDHHTSDPQTNLGTSSQYSDSNVFLALEDLVNENIEEAKAQGVPINTIQDHISRNSVLDHGKASAEKYSRNIDSFETITTATSIKGNNSVGKHRQISTTIESENIHKTIPNFPRDGVDRNPSTVQDLKPPIVDTIKLKEFLSGMSRQATKCQKKVPVAPDSKSIVGSRPKHWGVTNRLRRPVQPLLNVNEKAQRNRKNTVLAAAVGNSTLLQATKALNQTPHPDKKRNRMAMSDIVNIQFRHEKAKEMTTPRKILRENAGTFNPTTLARSISTKYGSISQIRDTIIDPTDKDSVMIGDESVFRPIPAASIGHSYTTSGFEIDAWSQADRIVPVQSCRKRKSNTNMGPLAARLKSLRDEANGDIIRFQSGQYPFVQRNRNKRNSSLCRDTNDPRNRALSHVDIHLMNNPIPFEHNITPIVAAVCYVHNFEQTERVLLTDASKSGPAWVLFSYETAREHNLMEGSELRIYNTIWLALPTSDDKATSVNDPKIRWLITCTSLCEPYPSHVLPPLQVSETEEATTTNQTENT